MAKPGSVSDVQISDWYYGETLAGKLFIKLRELCLGHETEALQTMGRTAYVPNAMLKHV